MKPTLTLLPYIIELCGYDYNSAKNSTLIGRHINWVSPKLYILTSMNVSVALAFYGLLKFYHGSEKELEWCDPWPKFLCIKGVVFMTFWQGICIQVSLLITS
jgi:Organic solute transporter Ostalpha